MSEITLAQVLCEFKMGTSEVNANKEMHCGKKQVHKGMHLTGDPRRFI